MISYDASNLLKVILSYQGTILPSVLSYMVWMLLWTGSLLFVFKFFELQFELGGQLHTFLGVAQYFFWSCGRTLLTTVIGKDENN